MFKKLFGFILAFAILSTCAFATTISPDTWAVSRGGKATRVSAPRMSTFTLTAVTASATVTTANLWVVITLKDGTTANMLIYKP